MAIYELQIITFPTVGHLVLEVGLSLLVEGDAGDFLDPVLVVGHPHVDAGQVGVGALDPVAHRPHQDPPGRTIIIPCTTRSTLFRGVKGLYGGD